MGRLAVLSVHYKYPGLLIDQARRLRECAGPVRERLGLDLLHVPILHGRSSPETVEAALEVSPETVDLRGNPNVKHPHGDALVEAFLRLGLTPEDRLVLLDHDAHPLRASALADLGDRLRENVAIGIPQWHRGHCYLHPSFLMTRVSAVLEMGPDIAFRGFYPEDGKGLRDTGERFTVWCEEHGRPLERLRVVSTEFPWDRWDSDMAPGGSPELVGEHGERVRAGYLMRYGLAEDRPLLSHLWAAPLKGNRFGGGHDVGAVLSAYLDEPMET